MELGNTLFIKKTSERKDPSYVYSRKISGYAHDYLRLSADRTKLYFRDETGDAIIRLDLATLDHLIELEDLEDRRMTQKNDSKFPTDLKEVMQTRKIAEQIGIELDD